MRLTPQTPSRLVQGAVLALLLTACGGGTEPSPPPPAPTSGTPPRIVAWETVPRVLDPAVSSPVTARVIVTGNASKVLFGRRGTPFPMPMTATDQVVPVPSGGGTVGGVVYELTTRSDVLLRDFVPRVGTNFAAVINAVTMSGEDTSSHPVNVIVSPALPQPSITRISETAQATDFVVNLAVSFDGAAVSNDGPWLGEMIAAGLRAIGRDPDFVYFAPPLYAPGYGSAFYRKVRNDVQGTGVTIGDLTTVPQYAALAPFPKLRGILSVRDPAKVDLAASHTIHELGHAFAAFLSAVYGPTGGNGHWPISELALGIMGYDRGTTSERFAYRFEKQPNGYVMRPVPRATGFNSMELYLMGLLPPAQVDSFLVFKDPATLPLPGDGVTVTAPARYITVDSVIAYVGPRVPPFGVAPTQFRVVTIILSAGRLLGPSEMAWYHYAAARGEEADTVSGIDGDSPDRTPPFRVATGGRGSMLTRIR